MYLSTYVPQSYLHITPHLPFYDLPTHSPTSYNPHAYILPPIYHPITYLPTIPNYFLQPAYMCTYLQVTNYLLISFTYLFYLQPKLLPFMLLHTTYNLPIYFLIT
jgi:hypothetical protein